MSNHREDQDWERVSELLRESDCVPDAPDCRSAVSARISRPARRSPAWAYGFAVALIAVAGVALLLPRHAPRPHKVELVKRQAPAPRNVVEQIPAQREVVKAVPIRREARVVKVHRSNTAREPRVLVVKSPVPRHDDVAEPLPETPVVHIAPTAAPLAERPIAIAIVTWPSANDRRDDSYSYRHRDTATGQTTECRVKRSGNSVEIYMESKPAADEPPVKGSLDHETKPSA